MSESLTQVRLKEQLHYEPRTGAFVWRVSPSNNTPAGSVAGAIRPDGYRHIKIDSKLYKAHRLAWLYMTGSFPADQTDHIDHQRDNNTFSNLREANHTENGRNMSLRPTNTSGICGVYWDKRRQKWRAQIQVQGKQTYIGSYTNIQDAIDARRAAEEKYGYHQNHGTPQTETCK